MVTLPPEISQALGFGAMTFLVLMFAWLYTRDRRKRTRQWLEGWIAIEVHFAGNLLSYLGWISAPLSGWLAYSTLLLAAAKFFLSVSQKFLTEKTRLFFWSLVFSPAILYLTLQAIGVSAKWPFAVILILIFASSAGIFLARAKRKVIAALVCLLLGVAAAAGVFGTGDPAHGTEVLLTAAFFITSVAWWLKFRRATPGVILTSISFAAWGSVWPTAELLRSFGLRFPEASVVWDLPKYFVAFGMIITVLEEQTEALRQEVSDRRQAENTLRETAFFLGESQRIAQLGSYTFNPVTGNCTMSAVAQQILGIETESTVSLGVLLDLLRSGDQDELTRHLNESVQAAGACFDREMVIRRKNDGAERYIHWRAAVIENGSSAGAINGTLQDVTESKIIQQELVQSKKMESIGRLAGGVAHDFNNLLTIINGYSELILTRMNGPDPMRSFVDEIRNAGVRAAELTQQLLAFSRRQTLQPVDLDLNAVILETERLLAHLIPKNIQIIPVLSAGLSKIKADPGQLTQVLMNLAVNARDAMPSGGRLTVETANVSRLPNPGAQFRADTDITFVRISVTDTGSGMDEETQKHLFEPFFTTKPRGSGTGLGLSTVYGIVKQSNGYINVQSHVGTGTRFDVYLPASAPASIEDPGQPRQLASSDASPNATTILVVDDERAARKLVATILTEAGYRTIEAPSGEEALALVRDRSCAFDLLLSDVVMPGISGRVLVERLRKIRPDTPAILMSGYTGDVLEHNVSDDDFAFLQKPFSPQRLIEVVEETFSHLERPLLNHDRPVA